TASGRASLDFAQALYNGEHKVTGSLICVMNAQSVTQIANARSAQAIILQLQIAGTGTRNFDADQFVGEYDTFLKDELYECGSTWQHYHSRAGVCRVLQQPLRARNAA